MNLVKVHERKYVHIPKKTFWVIVGAVTYFWSIGKIITTVMNQSAECQILYNNNSFVFAFIVLIISGVVVLAKFITDYVLD